MEKLKLQSADGMRFGKGVLLTTRQVKKVMASYVGENKEFERQVLSGELELELIPQGTLAERLRAGGAGIPGFYTRTGFGTKLTEGKETQKFDGKEYVLEPGITAEVSMVKAWKGDKSGNLIYRKTSSNWLRSANWILIRFTLQASTSTESFKARTTKSVSSFAPFRVLRSQRLGQPCAISSLNGLRK